MNRDEIKEHLHEILKDLPTAASLSWRYTGEDRWRETIPWPAAVPGRQRVANRIDAILDKLTEEAEILIRPEGLSRRGWHRLTWPGLPGLFGEVPEPPVATAGASPVRDDPGPAVIALVRLAGPPEDEGRPDEPQAASDPMRPCKASERAVPHILSILAARQCRMTGMRLMEELNLAGIEWSKRVVEATACWLVQRGLLTNSRDERGKGYGLVDWDWTPPESDPDLFD